MEREKERGVNISYLVKMGVGEVIISKGLMKGKKENPKNEAIAMQQ